MKTQKKTKAMDGMDRSELDCKIADVLDRAFMRNDSWENPTKELKEIYHKFESKVSRADFNMLIESAIESTVDCYQLLIDGFKDAEYVIRV